MTVDPRKPHDGLPFLPPGVELETRPVLKRCLGATRALAELKGVGGLLPDQTILINIIPLQEAKLSSEIENIVTTQDELFHAALDEASATDPRAKEVLRYRTALRHGYEAVLQGGLTGDLLAEVCSVLRDQKMAFRSEKELVYIGNRMAGTVTYTPPRGGRVLLDKLMNLEEFLLVKDGLDPLVRMAVAHYQFEAIHPFTDGNGRTGRILNILYLVHAGLLEIPVLYLSRFIIQNKGEYYRLLREVTENGAWEEWLLYMLQGVEETALWTTNRIRAIRQLFNATLDRVRGELPRIYSKELVELIFRQPYSKIQFLVEVGIAKRQTASVYLQELERIGILTSERRGREIVYKHPALVEVLSA
ncbi:MAG TPA: Fic family protein [Thermoanaerobaculia bacterium]